MYSSSAYAPFGEQYATAGSADASFTGMDQDTVSTLYDFPARRQSPSQGRWVSPDPAGRAAVNLANPQSWNRYAYVLNNPLTLIDPTGMKWANCRDDDDDDDGDSVHVRRGGVHADCSDDDDDDDDSNNPSTCDAQCQLDKQQNCADGLAEAGQTMAAVDNANAMWDTLQAAADANNIDPALLAAVGIRETGFQNIPQSGGGLAGERGGQIDFSAVKTVWRSGRHSNPRYHFTCESRRVPTRNEEIRFASQFACTRGEQE